MDTQVNLNKIYIVSDKVIAREIDGEVVIIPLIGGIGVMDADLYTLNTTGKSIWKLFDGKNTLIRIIDDMYEEYNSLYTTIVEDVVSLTKELCAKGLVSEIG